MSIYFDTIDEAVLHSRAYNEIATVRTDDWDAALAALRNACDADEEYDYVETGDVLEFWSYDPEPDDSSSTMRVHLVRGS